MKDHRSEGKRIPSEDLTAYERWELPLLDEGGNEVAREEERNVKPLTAADIEQIRKEAWEDGHKEGHDAGYKDGHEAGRTQGHKEGYEAGLAEGRDKGAEQALAETRKEVDVKLDRLEALLGELLVPIQRHEDELETALFNLTTVLARAVVYRELSIDSDHIRKVVRGAMDALPSTSDNVRIRIHPDDVQWVREVAERFEASTSIVEDENILPGGCKLETRHSLVDFTVEKRFQKAVQSMLDQQLDSDKPGDSVELDAMMGDLTDFHRDVLSSAEENAQPDAAEKGRPESPPADDDTGEEGENHDKPPG